MYKFNFNNKLLKDRRRELRVNQTEAEKKLWECLRGRRFGGLKFHRQFSVGAYILDFYCPQIRLGIELMEARIQKQKKLLWIKTEKKFYKPQTFVLLDFGMMKLKMIQVQF